MSTPRVRGRHWIIVATTSTLMGCATASRTDLTAFATTTTMVRSAVDQNFADANRLARGVAIDDFVRSGAIGLSERRFPPAVPTQVVAAWRSSLADLQRYSNLLALLSSGSRGGDATTALRGLGVGLRDGRSGVDIDAGVATAFAGLAGAIIDIKANASALAVMRRTDPDVRRLLFAMADSLGKDDASGLRATVASNWTASLSDLQTSYATAATEKAEARQRGSAASSSISLLASRSATPNYAASPTFALRSWRLRTRTPQRRPGRNDRSTPPPPTSGLVLTQHGRRSRRSRRPTHDEWKRRSRLEGDAGRQGGTGRPDPEARDERR